MPGAVGVLALQGDFEAHGAVLAELGASVREVRVVLNADVLDRLKKEDEEILIDLERKFQGRLSFRVNAKFHFEEFKLVNALTDEELS